MSVTLSKEVVTDLVNYKLGAIQNQINLILSRWNQTSTSQFIDKARSGELEEAENDAIDLRQLLLEEKKLRRLLDSF